MRLLHGVHAGDDRVDVGLGLVVGAARGIRDHHRVAVGRDLPLVAGGQGGVEVLNLGERRQLVDGLGDGGAERRVVDRPRVGADQDELALTGRVEVEALVDEGVGAARLPDGRVLLVDDVHRRRDADGECDHHEGEPSEDGGLAVGGAPAAHAGGEVAGVLERGHGSLLGPCARGPWWAPAADRACPRPARGVSRVTRGHGGRFSGGRAGGAPPGAGRAGAPRGGGAPGAVRRRGRATRARAPGGRVAIGRRA